MSTNAPHPYFARSEATYQNVVKPAFLKAKALFEQTGNPDDLLPFGMPNRPLPSENDPNDKGTGHNGSRQSPTVFVTTTDAVTDLPDGKSGVVSGEMYLRGAAEWISRRTHRMSTKDEVLAWRAAGAARKAEEERLLRERVSRKNQQALELEQSLLMLEKKNAAEAEALRLMKERIELEAQAAKLAKQAKV